MTATLHVTTGAFALVLTATLLLASAAGLLLAEIRSDERRENDD